MASVSKLDGDEDSSLSIFLNPKEFKRFSKKFKKMTKHSVEEYFSVRVLSKHTIKLTPKLDGLSEQEIDQLANITTMLIEDIGEYNVSVDGLYLIFNKINSGQVRLTNQLRYSLKVVAKLSNLNNYMIGGKFKNVKSTHR